MRPHSILKKEASIDIRFQRVAWANLCAPSLLRGLGRSLLHLPQRRLRHLPRPAPETSKAQKKAQKKEPQRPSPPSRKSSKGLRGIADPVRKGGRQKGGERLRSSLYADFATAGWGLTTRMLPEAIRDGQAERNGNVEGRASSWA